MKAFQRIQSILNLVHTRAIKVGMKDLPIEMIQIEVMVHPTEFRYYQKEQRNHHIEITGQLKNQQTEMIYQLIEVIKFQIWIIHHLSEIKSPLIGKK